MHEDEKYQPAHAVLTAIYKKKGDKEEAVSHRQRAWLLPAPAPKPKPEGGKA